MDDRSARLTVRLRTAVSVLAGIIAGIGMGIPLGPAAGVVGGWGALGVINTVWVLMVVPEYTDFVYFSLGLGMTYQVADTDVTANIVRRVVIAQTALAYLFGAVIVATVINLVTSLGG